MEDFKIAPFNEVKNQGDDLQEKSINGPFQEVKQIKLKDTLYMIHDESSIKTENPVNKLKFSNYGKTKKNKIGFNFWLALIILFFFINSILLNSFFLKNLDPLLFNVCKKSVAFLNNSFFTVQGLFTDQLSRPYIVTIGEYGNVAVAKEDAVRFLPKLKQINIKELKSGVLTFEIERFGSKSEAYKLAYELKQDGFEAVHVRYLPGKQF